MTTSTNTSTYSCRLSVDETHCQCANNIPAIGGGRGGGGGGGGVSLCIKVLNSSVFSQKSRYVYLFCSVIDYSFDLLVAIIASIRLLCSRSKIPPFDEHMSIAQSTSAFYY